MSGWTIAAMSRTTWPTSNVAGYRSMRPASILDRSRMSLMRPSRCLPAALTRWRSGMNASSPTSSASSWSISLYPMIAFSGVRSSWDMLARNCDRVSTTGQTEEGYGLEGQVTECLALAERIDATVQPDQVYREVGSGADWNLPMLLDLLERAKRREFDVVIS